MKTDTCQLRENYFVKYRKDESIKEQKNQNKLDTFCTILIKIPEWVLSILLKPFRKLLNISFKICRSRNMIIMNGQDKVINYTKVTIMKLHTLFIYQWILSSPLIHILPCRKCRLISLNFSVNLPLGCKGVC